MLLGFGYSYYPHLEEIAFTTSPKIKFANNFHLEIIVIIYQKKYKYKKGYIDGFFKIKFNYEFNKDYYIESSFEAELYTEVSDGINVRAKNYI